MNIRGQKIRVGGLPSTGGGRHGHGSISPGRGQAAQGALKAQAIVIDMDVHLV